MQHRHRRPGQLHPRRREQLPRLGQAEPQILRADLGQLAFQPQPVQAQPHIMPGRQHEPQPRRRPHQQQLQLPQHLSGSSSCTSSTTSHSRFVQRRQVVKQPLHQRPPVQVRRRRHRPHQLRPRARRRRAPTTDSQNRCGSRTPRPASTHAARPARPAWPIHDRSSTVFPLPAAPDTTVTRAGPRAARTAPDATPPRPHQDERPARQRHLARQAAQPSSSHWPRRAQNRRRQRRAQRADGFRAGSRAGGRRCQYEAGARRHEGRLGAQRCHDEGCRGSDGGRRRTSMSSQAERRYRCGPIGQYQRHRDHPLDVKATHPLGRDAPISGISARRSRRSSSRAPASPHPERDTTDRPRWRDKGLSEPRWLPARRRSTLKASSSTNGG